MPPFNKQGVGTSPTPFGSEPNGTLIISRFPAFVTRVEGRIAGAGSSGRIVTVSAVLRMSTLFLRTLRDDPVDAEVASHRLLVRAGYIRRAAPGGFSWLPLGWRVLRKVEQIVRDEMDAAGFQEVHFPALLPREPYEALEPLDRVRRQPVPPAGPAGADFLLAPTHEEMFTLLVKDMYGSYKDLPLSTYQIQTKFRDEARPRAGLLRGREFVMKDSYSFDLDDEPGSRSPTTRIARRTSVCSSVSVCRS